MSEGGFGGRRNALEEKFFLEKDKELIQALREQTAAKARKRGLAEAAGITYEEVLDQLDDLGVSAETLAALSLIPLIAVAWADGKLDEKELEAVMTAADNAGMHQQHAGHQLLDAWLKRRPDNELLAVWKSYVASLSISLSEEALNDLKNDLLGHARTVAEAAGGILGLGSRVSKAEQAILDELAQAFE